MDVNKKYRLQWVCFLAYLLFLSYLLFFSNFFGRTGQEEEYRYNLTLFLEIERYYSLAIRTGKVWPFIINVLGNICVFVPVGIFLPILIKRCRNAFFTGLICFEISLAVELIQLFTRVGSFDVDDLLLNTIGGIVGFFVYFCYSRHVRRDKKVKSCRKGK